MYHHVSLTRYLCNRRYALEIVTLLAARQNHGVPESGDTTLSSLTRPAHALSREPPVDTRARRDIKMPIRLHRS